MKFIYYFILFLFFSISCTAIEYQGNNELCFLDTRNNETCINSLENFSYNDSKDYIIKINDIEYNKSIKGLGKNFNFDNTQYIGYSLLLFALFIGLILFLRSYLDY